MTTALKTDIREDVKYKKFKHIVLTEEKKIDEAVHIEELTGLHTSRISRTLYGKKGQYSAETLMEASLQDLSVRSRMVEIRVQLALHADIIETAIKSISKYIYVEYLLNDPCYTTEGQRNNFISDFLARWNEDLRKYKSIIEMADTFIKDIDQAGFNLRNMMDCLKLLSETKGKII